MPKKHGQEDVYDAYGRLSTEFRTELEQYFTDSPGTSVWKLQNMAKFVPRQALARFLLKAEIFKKILDVQGAIVECGVFGAGGLMTWYQLSSIFEPINNLRRIIGFDTFDGFPHVADQDGGGEFVYEGGLDLPYALADAARAVDVHKINKIATAGCTVQLIEGDAMETIPVYMQKEHGTVVALLYLDFDLYKPTKCALEHFVPRMPKGAVIAWDELGDPGWPGETLATIEHFGNLNGLRAKRFTYDTSISYAVLE